MAGIKLKSLRIKGKELHKHKNKTFIFWPIGFRVYPLFTFDDKLQLCHFITFP